MNKDVLSFENVNFSYHTKDNETLAINNLSFNIKQGEFVSIVGPSGCGKTTILSLISGLLKPSSGKITFGDNDSITEKEEVTKIGYMFQKDYLFEWRTIWKNVCLSLELRKKTKDTNEIKNADNLLKKYGLHEFKNRYPNQLSGGMRQRVALIRTLVMRPQLLLLDEPFSALDFQNRLKVCDDVYSILRKEHKTAILVTHDISEAVSFSDKVIVLTKRPASVKRIVDIEMRECGLPFNRREDNKFSEYFNTIWKELSEQNETPKT